MKTRILGLLAVGLLTGPMMAGAIPVDTELSLVIDVSPSISDADFAIQMQG